NPAVAYATAVSDCVGPVFSNIATSDEPPFRVYVSWNTSEASTSRVDYGSTTALGKSVSDAALTTSHQLVLTGLDACGLVYFKVSGTDARGNTSVADRGGAIYSFETGHVPGAVFIDGFESPTGWTLEGEWQIASAQGKGGGNGYSDSTSAYNGPAVVGSAPSGLGASPGGNAAGTNSWVIFPKTDAANPNSG